MPDFLPQKERELSFWLRSFTRLIVADPASWDVDPAAARELLALHATFAAAAARAAGPATRTASAIAGRDDAKAALLPVVRRVACTVRNATSVSNERRIELGLRPPKGFRSRAKAPTSQPIVTAEASGSHGLLVRLTDPSSPHRVALPAGVSSAQVHVALGELLPGADAWRFHSVHTVARFALTVGGTLDYGQSVWVRARWADARARPGPFSRAVNVRLIGGPDVLTMLTTLAA